MRRQRTWPAAWPTITMSCACPGAMFGPGQEAYLRFAFANLEAELMPALVERLVASQG